MTGNLIPDIDHLGPEGKITFGDYFLEFNERGTPEKLVDGLMNTLNKDTTSGVFLDTYYSGGVYFTFTLYQKSNVWSISEKYTDGGGTSNLPVNLYKLSDSGIYEKSGEYSTNPEFKKWYILFNGLEPGTYKVTPTGRYSSFCEWYIESVSLTLYKEESSCHIYGVNNGDFIKLAEDFNSISAIEKKALFESTNHEVASIIDLKTIGPFKVLKMIETNSIPLVTMTAVPKDQLIMPKSFISVDSFNGIDQAILTDTVSGTGACKIIVTTDLKTYQTYDFEKQAWNPIDHADLVVVKQSGIDAAALQNIDRAAWDKLLKGKSGIGFAYLMGIDAITDQCAIDQITLQANMKGTWK